MNRHIFFLAVLIPCLFICGTAKAIVPYTVTDLGTLGGEYSYAYGINNIGQVVGTATSLGGAYHAFLYSGSIMTDLGTLGKMSSEAWDINDSGQIAGRAFTPNVTSRAFLYNGSTMIDLGTLGGNSSDSYGINDSGQVVGSALITGNTASHAFLYNGLTMNDLDPLGGDSCPFDINASGHIVGFTSIIGSYHACLYKDSTMIDLGSLGGNGSIAWGINDNDQIVGWSHLAGEVILHAFLYSNSTMIDLGTLGGKHSIAYGINNSGQIVGQTETADGIARAFLYSESTMYDLNTLIDPLSGFHLAEARDINDLGQIVGWGVIGKNQPHAFLLTPVPEPSVLTLLCSALLGIGWILSSHGSRL